MSTSTVDNVGHGTRVAGIIAGDLTKPDQNGYLRGGVAERLKIMVCKATDDEMNVLPTNIAKCIKFARQYGAHIINVSIGGGDYNTVEENEIRECLQRGIIVVCASGNDGIDLDKVPLYPACYRLDNVVTVGASNK